MKEMKENIGIPQEIKFVNPRPTVEVHLPDGQVLNGPRGAAVGEYMKMLVGPDDPPIVGAIVNCELRELTYPIKMDASVEPVSMDSPDGMRIYRRSLTFLMETAFNLLFPGAVLKVDHSVASGG